MKLIKLFIFLSVLCLSTNAFSQPKITRQVLDQKNSSLKFTLENQMLDLSGKFTEYSGSFRPDSSGSDIKADLKIDLSAVALSTDQSPQFALIENLIQSFPSPQVTFESSRFIPKSPGNYIMEGIVSRAGTKKTLRLPVQIKAVGEKITEITFLAKGDILNSGEFPQGFNMLEGYGSLSGKLIFKALS